MTPRPFGVIIALSCALATSAPAAVIYTYDFPGPQATSGLATNQTNSQPANGTFSDFTRNNLAATDPNVFGSKNWTASATVDPTQYEGFSITAAAGYSLNLTQLTFDIINASNGPAHFQVSLYVNGSSSPYATSADFATQGVSTTLTFDFTDLTGTNNASTVEFRFFGWSAPNSGAHLDLDNVATYGTIGAVSEWSNMCAAIVPSLAGLHFACRFARSRYKRSRQTVQS